MNPLGVCRKRLRIATVRGCPTSKAIRNGPTKWIPGIAAQLAVLSLMVFTCLGQPDLAIDSPSLSPRLAFPGDVASVECIITNHGEDATNASFFVQLLVDGREVARKPIEESIGPGASLLVSFSWAFTAGMHEVWFRADAPESLIDEGDEENNEAALSIGIGTATLSSVTPWYPNGDEFLLVHHRSVEETPSPWWNTGAWEVVQDGATQAIRSAGHTRLEIGGANRIDGVFVAQLKPTSGETLMGCRSDGGRMYAASLNPGGFYELRKEVRPGKWETLATSSERCPTDEWIMTALSVRGDVLELFADGRQVATAQDAEEPLLQGSMALEVQASTQVEVAALWVADDSPNIAVSWEPCGGPPGGMGYDVVFDPADPSLMYVTEAYSGIYKSFNGGAFWLPKNAGILASRDQVLLTESLPIFCVRVDPLDTNTVWVGTLNGSGIYKSEDAGESWERMNEGIQEPVDSLSIRGFAIHPKDSNTVLMLAGVASTTPSRFGGTFSRSSGVIYKTNNGGESWRRVWQGDNLARIGLYDPTNPDIVYASTGIFDYVAENDWGVGVLKSTDGGETWTTINSGLQCLYVGYITMHPNDPNTLLAGSGAGIMNAIGVPGGLYRTTDGGENWEVILSVESAYFTAVGFSPADPDVIYALENYGIYRSDDGGNTWKMFDKPFELNVGPPGVKPGHPIGIALDPDDPMVVYFNGYQGGVFRSTDGGVTWENWSSGYTGVHVNDIDTSGVDTNTVFAACQGGLFASHDQGDTWKGLAYPEANKECFTTVACDPSSSGTLLASGLLCNPHTLFRSENGGDKWSTVIAYDPMATRHPFASVIVHAPSNPSVVYAGFQFEGAGSEPVSIEQSWGVYRSNDGGATWSQVNRGLNATTLNIQAIAVDPVDPLTVYLGTAHDGAFKSDDGGYTWVPISSGLRSANVCSLEIDPLFPGTVYAGLGEGAGVFISTDAGENWQSLNYGLSIECPSFLARVGEVRKGLSLERAPTRAQYSQEPTWSVVSQILIHPKDNLTVFLLDELTGVYASVDGGSWLPLRQGMSGGAGFVTDIALSSDGKTLFAGTGALGVFRMDLEGSVYE